MKALRGLEGGAPNFEGFLNITRELTKIMEEISATENLVVMIYAEQSIVKLELSAFTERPLARDTFRQAVSDLAELQDKLATILDDAESYHYFVRVGTRKRDLKNGLPVDGVRKLLSSQLARIRNLYPGRIKTTESELRYLDARLQNFITAERLYIRDQKKAITT